MTNRITQDVIWQERTITTSTTCDVRTYFIKLYGCAPRLSLRLTNACQSPTTAGTAPDLLAERSSGRAIMRWMDCLARASCACCAVWSAAAMLPHQPRSRPGTRPAVYHVGHKLAQTRTKYATAETHLPPPLGAAWGGGVSHISPASSTRASRAKFLSLALHLTAKVRNICDNPPAVRWWQTWQRFGNQKTHSVSQDFA